MIKIFFFSFVLLGNFLAIYAQDDFPYDKYSPRTLAEIGELNIASQNDSPASKDLKIAGLIFHADFFVLARKGKIYEQVAPDLSR